MKTVAYYRVSTQQQGRSGLGLAAQEKAVGDFIRGRNADLVETFTEIESGKRCDRPQLEQALHLTKITGATLVIAKLDRLSRSASFLLALRDSGVKFIAVDQPDANEMTVGILAVIAEGERKAISERTRAALQAAKARGQVLGNPNGAAALKRANKGNGDAILVVKNRADQNAMDLAPVIASIQSMGVTTLGGIARILNERGVLTPRNGKWHRTSVRNLLNRIDQLGSRAQHSCSV